MTLFWQQFRARLPGMIIWVGVSVLLALMTAQTAPSFIEQGNFTGLMKSLPPSLQAMVGIPEGLSPVDGYVATQVTKNFGLVVALYAVLLALSAVTREVDRRTIDFLLALPVKRTSILWSRVGVMALNTGVQVAAMWITLRVALAALGLSGSWAGYALIMLNVWLLAMALGGATLLASLWIDDYSLAVKLFLGLMAASYVLEFVLRAAGVSRLGRVFSPFSYIDPVETLRRGALPWVDVLVLTAVAAVTVGVSVRVFQRKQITA